MIEFKDQNQRTLTSFTEVSCPTQEVYLAGLRAGEILVSYDPYYLQTSNGLIVGLDETFRQFYHLDENRDILRIIPLDWRDDCDSRTLAVPLETTTPNASVMNVTSTVDLFSALLFIGVICSVILNRKRLLHD